MPTSAEASLLTTDQRAIDDAVRRAQQGDIAAFETIYRVSAPAVYRLCRRMISDEREARELVQDVFVRAWEKLPTFRNQSALGTWLHRLTANLVIQHLRSSGRRAARFIDVDSDAPLPARSSAIESQLDVDAAIARLPDGARSVLALHLEGYSHDEIAQLLGIAAGTARTQLFRARRALMHLLDA